MADAHKNFAYSTVATAPSPASSGTSLVVASGDGTKFPAVSFNAMIWPAGAQPTTANAEIVRVSAISTDTFTITRTQESTSARTVVVGDQIGAGITAKTLTDVELASDSLWAAAGDLVQGTGNDTAAILSAGTTVGTVPVSAGAAAALAYGQPIGGKGVYLAPSGAIAETLPRDILTSQAISTVSGTLRLQAIFLPKGVTVTSISFRSVGAASTPTHWWFSLHDSARVYLRSTADQTTTAWGATTTKTVNLSSTFATTYEGLHYLGFMMAASTVPNLYGIAGIADIVGVAPILGGTSSTSLTTAVSDGTTAGAITATSGQMHGWVS